MAPKGQAKAKAKAKASARDRSRTPAPQDVTPSDLLKNLKSLLLGLERRPDRRQRAEEMLAREVPWLQVEFFKATDGKVDTIPDTQVSETWNTKCNSFYGSYEDIKAPDGVTILHKAADFADPGVVYKFSPGERGCAHSHYRMWERVAESNAPMLILEDDVKIDFEREDKSKATGASFTARLELGMQECSKRNADVLYLGWSGFRDGHFKHHKATPGRKNPVIRKAEYVWTTVAYVLWPAGAKKLLKAAQPMNQPVDNFMAWECREGRLESYVLLDENDTNDTWAGGIVTQYDFTGDSDIKKSDGGDQGDDPTVFLASEKAAAIKAALEANVEATVEAAAEKGA